MCIESLRSLNNRRSFLDTGRLASNCNALLFPHPACRPGCVVYDRRGCLGPPCDTKLIKSDRLHLNESSQLQAELDLIMSSGHLALQSCSMASVGFDATTPIP